MSQVKGNASDDEFQDAIGDSMPINIEAKSTGKQTNDEAIEELIQKQNDLKLPDEDENENAEDIDEAEGKNETGDNDDEEAELRAREKIMTDEELQQSKEEADKMKLEGNEFFKNGHAERSIEVYTAALQICPTKYSKERAILYGNRAAAKIQLDAKKSAIEDCSKAIEYWPEYVRALIRRAKLYEHDDKPDEALADYKRVYELDPGQHEAREAIVRLPPVIAERNERMKEEMLSKLKDLGNMILKPFGLSTSNFQMQQDPNTGSYSVNFNQNQS